jgi:tRNA (guanine-N7-)-methyltransferase
LVSSERFAWALIDLISACFLRGGKMETGQQKGLVLELDQTDNCDPVLDWDMVFGNTHPVEIEIGIGKGRFLIEAAQNNLQVNYIGVERAAKYLRIAQARSLKRNLENIRLILVSAQDFLEFFVPTESVRAIHLYFPDPWPKKRHHKRRLFNVSFIKEVERILEPGGRLWLATDHEDYFAAMLEVLDGSTCLSEIEVEWPGVKTNYEEKYISQGKIIHRRILEKAR